MAAVQGGNALLLLVHLVLHAVLCLLFEVVFLEELLSLLLFLFDLEPKLPEPSLDLLADRVNARLECQLLIFLVLVGLAKAGRRDLDQAVLVIDESIGERVKLLDEVVHAPHARDLLPDF